MRDHDQGRCALEYEFQALAQSFGVERAEAFIEHDMKKPNSTTARIEARLPVEVHAMLKRAAEIRGKSVTDFVVAESSEVARRTIEATEMIHLSANDQQFSPKAFSIHLNPTTHSFGHLKSTANCSGPSERRFSYRGFAWATRSLDFCEW